MNLPNTDQLDKVLALAESVHDGEALGAIRTAQRILSRNGLSIRDLARAATVNGATARPAPSTGSFTLFSSRQNGLDVQIVQMRQQLNDLQSQLQTQELQLEFWRRRAADLEQTQMQAQAEAQRWRILAKETAEQLWDLGQSMQHIEPSGATPFEDELGAGEACVLEKTA